MQIACRVTYRGTAAHEQPEQLFGQQASECLAGPQNCLAASLSAKVVPQFARRVALPSQPPHPAILTRIRTTLDGTGEGILFGPRRVYTKKILEPYSPETAASDAILYCSIRSLQSW